MKRLTLCLLFLMLSAPAWAGSGYFREYTLFNGSNVDSTAQASRWFPIRGASHVIIRTWTSKAAFHASTDADSTFSDSLTIWTTLFSDSAFTTVSGLPIMGDSLAVTSTTADHSDSTKMVRILGAAVSKQLRGAANGSGVETHIVPLNAATTPSAVLGPAMMRVRVTPLRRMTVTGSQSTQGIRVNGLKGLRMRALVYFPNN